MSDDRLPLAAEVKVKVPAPSGSWLLKFPLLYHLGDMNVSKKKRGSYEGSGLSVSGDPEAWASIARLGGKTLWELRKADGRFLDFHATSTPWRKSVEKWALAQGYLTQGKLYEVSYYDDEQDAEVRTLFTTREAAAEEADAGERDVTERKTVLATSAMTERGFQHKDPHGMAQDLAILFYVEDELPKLDGVWWNDNDDPIRLSAPRGVIFARSLASWGHKKLPGERPYPSLYAYDGASED